jgi:hypothetical protein
MHCLYSAWLLSVIVEKSKKCVDFTVTLYFIDIVFCVVYQVCISMYYTVKGWGEYVCMHACIAIK